MYYDANGNMISRQIDAESINYEYDANNKLKRISDGISNIEFQYDAMGNRIQKTINDTTVVNYLIDINRKYAQVIEERNENDELSISYIYGHDLISQKKVGGKSFYHYDGTNSCRQITDINQNVISTNAFDAYGNRIMTSGALENNYLFAGEQFDFDAELYYLRARYYDQSSGRFISQDPYFGDLNNPVTLNKYVYAGNNPVNYIDPSGLLFCQSTFGWGKKIHDLISSHFMSWVSMQTALQATGHTQIGMKRSLGVASRLMPDLVLVTPNFNEIYEIKPVLGVYIGWAKLGGYLGVANAARAVVPGLKPTYGGILYDPPHYIPLDPPGKFAIVSPTMAGLILYCMVDVHEELAGLFAVLAASVIRGFVIIPMRSAPGGGIALSY